MYDDEFGQGRQGTSMDNGWENSAPAWIDSVGERGDWGREHVLDRPC
jgi:hypothetical protein